MISLELQFEYVIRALYAFSTSHSSVVQTSIFILVTFKLEYSCVYQIIRDLFSETNAFNDVLKEVKLTNRKYL